MRFKANADFACVWLSRSREFAIDSEEEGEYMRTAQFTTSSNTRWHTILYFDVYRSIPKLFCCLCVSLQRTLKITLAFCLATALLTNRVVFGRSAQLTDPRNLFA